MSRQLEAKQEERSRKKNDRLAAAVDFGLVDGLESQGAELLGLAIKHDANYCLLTIKADVGGVRMVAFVGSDTIANCFLKAESDALDGELHWRVDKYHQKQV